MDRIGHELTKLLIDLALDWVLPRKPRAKSPAKRTVKAPPTREPVNPRLKWVANSVAALTVVLAAAFSH